MPLGTEVGIGPSDIVLDGDPAPPDGKGPPTFRLMSSVAKRSPISATAALLIVFQLLFRGLEMFYSFWRQADDDTNDMSPDTGLFSFFNFFVFFNG